MNGRRRTRSPRELHSVLVSGLYTLLRDEEVTSGEFAFARARKEAGRAQDDHAIPTMVSEASARRATFGPESVRQYVQAMLQW